MTTKTSLQFWNQINSIETVNFLSDLSDRWQDEKEYEDFSDYLLAMKNVIGSEIDKATKKPFGFQITCSDGPIHVFLKNQSNGNIQLKIKRI